MNSPQRRDPTWPTVNLRRIGVAILLLFMVAPTIAQSGPTYPSRAVRIVVPFPAGGPTDILSRVLAQRMSEDWAQPVLVENRAGADTMIGAQFVAKAAPDGYTLLAAMDTTLVLNLATKGSLPYDPYKDFTYISLASKNTSLLTVRAADGASTVQELIERAKSSPGKLNYGAGILTTRLAGYLLAREAGIEVQLIPYKGSADVVQALLTGSVDFIIDGVASSLPLIQSGSFRPLAKLNNRPLPALPNVPPLSIAARLPALDDISSWTGIVAPAGTPHPIVEKIQREIAGAFADRSIYEKLEKSGINPVASTPEEFESFFRKEAGRWLTIFKESGIRLD
jgi:tripartite-type tricarboxylate transporter receptor subunit TctC